MTRQQLIREALALAHNRYNDAVLRKREAIAAVNKYEGEERVAKAHYDNLVKQLNPKGV